MNFDDPFADDLKSLNAVMAELSADQDRRSHPPPPIVPAGNSSVNSTTGLEGRSGRRGVVSAKGPTPHVQLASTVAGSMKETPAVVRYDPLPWEMDDGSPPMTRTHVFPSAAFVSERPRSEAARESRHHHEEREEDEDPLAFLDVASPSPAVATTTRTAPSHAMSAAAAVSGVTHHHVENEETRRKTEQRDLLSSIDAVGMEIDQINSALDTLQIKADTELTELDTKIIEKQTELATMEDRTVHERQKYESYHQRRLKSVSDQTKELLQRQEEEVRSLAKGRFESQLSDLSKEVADVKDRIDQLSQQRELLLQHHKYDEKGIFLALAKEEEKVKASTSTTDVANGDDNIHSGDSIEIKMSAALRLLRQHHDEHLEFLAGGVVQFIHQETMDVAREIRESHEMAYIWDAVRRKEEFSEFMQDFLQRYREFFLHRTEVKSRNMDALRQGLQEATEQLRLHTRKRLERRTQEISSKMSEDARRFEKNAIESLTFLHRKAAAIRDSDDAVAKSQRSDLEQRCQVEQSVIEKLQRSEIETLQQQLERIRRLRDDTGNTDENKRSPWQQVAEGICTERAESLTSKVKELGLSVQEQIRKQHLRNQAHRVEGEGNLLVTDEELCGRMIAQEKETIVVSLLDEVQKRQSELLAKRQRCGEMRESISTDLQRDVQTLQQQRLSQESHLASIELLRIAWEREQRELLQWGHNVMLTHDNPIDSSTTTATTDATTAAFTTARTHVPTATTTIELMNRLAERNRAIMESRSKLRTQRRNLLQAMDKECGCLLAEWRETETHWVEFCEQLMSLVEGEDAAAMQRAAISTEIAKMAAMKELINHDQNLFCRRREELQEETEHLKRELQLALTKKAEHNELRQKIASEQTELAQKQHRLAVEQSRLENFPSDEKSEDDDTRTVHHYHHQSLINSFPLKKTALACSTDKLQEVSGGDNVATPTGKQPHPSSFSPPSPPTPPPQQQSRREMRRNTLPPSMSL